MAVDAQAQRVFIGKKVALSMIPERYPDRPPRVAVMKTHMSWVFLIRARVYPLKRPVRPARPAHARSRQPRAATAAALPPARAAVEQATAAHFG